MAVLELDSKGRCLFVASNRAFLSMVSIRSSNLIGKPISNLLPEDDCRAISAVLNSAVYRDQLKIQSSFNHDPQTSVTIKVRLLSSGLAKKLLLTAEMASEEAAANSQANQREDFIATLTHDLKTPLVGANMVLTALLEGTLGGLAPAQQEVVEKLRTSNQALVKMIQNLLEVYKYESGMEALRFDGANLSEIVRFCADDVRPLMQNKNITLTVDCRDADIPLICDEYVIKRVLINLLGNAAKFTAASGKVSIAATEDGDQVRIAISDTGRGIPGTERAKIFERFWQGDPGRSYSVGTGLGLYFCSNVVKAHGGTITCQSAVGKGTTFEISLPRHIYAD